MKRHWQIVPVVPNDSMCTAAHSAHDLWDSYHCDNMREVRWSFLFPRWKAALEVAPKVPLDEARVQEIAKTFFGDNVPEHAVRFVNAVIEDMLQQPV